MTKNFYYITLHLQAKSTKKKLFTQNSLLSETPIGTPVQSQSSQPYLGHQQKKTRTRTKIIKKGSPIIARQPSPPCANKENVYPNIATQVCSQFVFLFSKKILGFKTHLNKKNVETYIFSISHHPIFD